ncbi:sucrose-6-phosphate hydrolase-like [Aricia agestis]|uniref:sucrose-6-phosphate hydrolase-like n=1 Tax=Aricia agestis TaxID=91739 RepID=UPI001C208B9B|nr:sucrose-6-phosphate hydrolase-like [Aricia agestis]
MSEKSLGGETKIKFYPLYHLAPPRGWMNDPNGFSSYNNYYHLFYQYNPFNSHNPGIVHWGHARSKDFFHWEDLGIAMSPDKAYDKDGVYSGSAIVENNNMYLFYTGNVDVSANPNHVQCQALATSANGINFTKHENNPLIKSSSDVPDIRDPKVWKHNGTYFMVLGNSFNSNTLGRVLLYTSDDKINWKNVGVLAESNGDLGYMWECPDFFELNGLFVLLFSPQGVKPQGDKYRNLYQTGYLVGKFDYVTYKFTIAYKFREIDNGHDFYATQTMLNKKEERIMVAWFDMWEMNYPEQDQGFNGHMTIPRILTLSPSGLIIQKPVREIKNARGKLIHTGKTNGNTTIKLNNNAAEITVIATATKDFTLYIETQKLMKHVILTFDISNATVTLDRGGNDGVRRTTWKPSGSSLKWTIYVDSSSVELFCGEGEVTFSSRFFPEGQVSVRVGEDCQADLLKIYNMKQTLYTKSDFFRCS